MKQAAEPSACNTRPGLTPGKESPVPKATADLISVTPLHNLSLGEIVDQLGHAKAAAADAKATGDRRAP